MTQEQPTNQQQDVADSIPTEDLSFQEKEKVWGTVNQLADKMVDDEAMTLDVLELFQHKLGEAAIRAVQTEVIRRRASTYGATRANEVAGFDELDEDYQKVASIHVLTQNLPKGGMSYEYKDGRHELVINEELKALLDEIDQAATSDDTGRL